MKVIHVLEGLQQAEHMRRLNKDAINKDWRLTGRELEADLGLPKTTVSQTLTQDLGMKRVVAKFIPWLLLPEQKEHRATVANDLIQTAINEPDLAPCNFWLFPKLKSPLKGRRFQTVNEIQENTAMQLMAIPTKDFGECFEQWKRCWGNCVRSRGAYFEGD